MKRLTRRIESGKAYFPHCFRKDTCNGMGSDKCTSCEFLLKVCETLAAYEDTAGEPKTKIMGAQITDIRYAADKCVTPNELINLVNSIEGEFVINITFDNKKDSENTYTDMGGEGLGYREL